MIDVGDDQQRHRGVIHQLAGVAAEPERGDVVFLFTHDDHQVHILLFAPVDDRLGNLSVNVNGGGGVANIGFAAHTDGMVELDVDDVLRLGGAGGADAKKQQFCGESLGKSDRSLHLLECLEAGINRDHDVGKVTIDLDVVANDEDGDGGETDDLHGVTADEHLLETGDAVGTDHEDGVF